MYVILQGKYTCMYVTALILKQCLKAVWSAVIALTVGALLRGLP